MAMICEVNGVYLVGKDLVDCTTGTYQSHGTFRKATDRNQDTFEWKSTFLASESERILYAAIKSAGSRFSFFRSQGI